MSATDLEIALLVIGGLLALALIVYLARQAERRWRKFRIGFFIERDFTDDEKD